MRQLAMIVKGGASTAYGAATRRGFDPARLTVERSTTFETTLVLANATDADERRVQAWFVEDPLVAPFPAGACVHYANRWPKQAGELHQPGWQEGVHRD